MPTYDTANGILNLQLNCGLTVTPADPDHEKSGIETDMSIDVDVKIFIRICLLVSILAA